MAKDPDTSLSLDARRARRLLLARAVEEADSQGRLLSQIERDQIERAALHAVAGAHHAQAPDAARYLDERARRMVEAVRQRDARTAALQHVEPWQRWLGWGLPLLALALGATLERIDNPGQVNMLSPPLLAFVLWNLLIYLALLLRPLWPRRAHAGPGGLAAALRDWLGHPHPLRGRRHVRGAVAARFRLHWWRIASAVEGWRIARILHASAAMWAVGVGLSIVVGGLVREYRVGWESTLLSLPQVHALLSALFAPVVALLPLEGFSLADLERMHFGSGAAVGQAQARHWIALYLGLLALLVVVPRVLLALYAQARARWLGRALRVNLKEPYFDEVLARVSPARVLLLWTAAQPEAGELMRRLWSEASAQAGLAGERFTPLRTDRGDELEVCELTLPAAAAPVAAPVQAVASEDVLPAPESPPGPAPAPARQALAIRAPARWLGRLQSWWASSAAPPPPAQPDADLWIVALSAPAQLLPLLGQLHALPRPVLLLNAGTAEDAAALRHAAELARLPAQVLDLQASAGCWAWEAPLREAIAHHLPPHKAPGAQRLLTAWQAQHEERLQHAMRLLAEPLLMAARDVQEVAAAPLSLRRLVDADEREASQQARRQAMADLLSRLSRAQEQSQSQMRRLYALGPAAAPHAAEAELARRFVVRQSVDAPQAGMAGAASGAAAGAGIDLMTGGLTLGAAAALGALVGGGAAFMAAALKNRATPGGTTQVQLSDDMLQALCELALLQYLAIAWRGPELTQVPPGWRSDVVAVVEAHRSTLQTLWNRARQTPRDPALAGELAELLGTQARELLERLRP